MIALLLLLSGCHRADDSAEPVADTDTTTTPPFGSPLEATDSDPADGALSVTLRAAPLTYAVPGVGELDGYAYNETVPGPTLRAHVGDTLTITLENALATTTSIHWHGLSVPNNVDGVDFLTDPLLPGGVLTATFTVEQPGTFWYHPHIDTDQQVDLGLYGVIVVEDDDDRGLTADDLILVFDTWGESDEDHHGLFDPSRQVWTVNGAVLPTYTLSAPTRGRILNASNSAYLSFPNAQVIGGDQGPYGALSIPEVLVLAPGDRAEVELQPGTLSTLPWTVAGGAALGEAIPLIQFEGSAGAGSWGHVGDLPTADAGTTDLRYVLQGGSEDWFINGETWPDVTTDTVALGSRPIIEVRNLSETNHPFHTHGQPFEVLSIDGVAPTTRIIEDTIDVPIRSVVRLMLIADNPGEWLVHCHILGHEAGGMMTLLDVTP